jgi:hypothetical protein
MTVTIRASTLVVLAVLGCSLASMAGDLSDARVTFRSGKWSVRRSKDTMTDKVSCTGIYNNDFGVQLSESDLFIRIRGGVQSVTLRFDDEPAQKLRLASEMEKKLDVADINGADFERLLSSKRLRMQALTLVRGLSESDLDLTGLRETLDNIKGGCPDTGTASPQGKVQTIGLCTSKVVSRLKARGLSEEAIGEICKED